LEVGRGRNGGEDANDANDANDASDASDAGTAVMKTRLRFATTAQDYGSHWSSDGEIKTPATPATPATPGMGGMGGTGGTGVNATTSRFTRRRFEIGMFRNTALN